MNMIRSTRSTGASSAAETSHAAVGLRPLTGRVSAYLKDPGRSFVHVEPDLSGDWGRAGRPANAHTEGPIFG